MYDTTGRCKLKFLFEISVCDYVLTIIALTFKIHMLLFIDNSNCVSHKDSASIFEVVGNIVAIWPKGTVFAY
jgi:hypothetical protein